MPQFTLRSFRTLLVVATVAGASAGTVAAPASAAGTAKAGHTAKAKPAKKAKAVTKTKKGKAKAGQPDLVARGLELEFLADAFQIDAKVVNLGTRRARKSEVSIAISGDDRFDAADEVLETVPMNRLQPGVERSVSAEVEIPEDLPGGELYLLVCADGPGVIAERNETNNCTSELIASESDDDVSDDEPSADEDDVVADEPVSDDE